MEEVYYIRIPKTKSADGITSFTDKEISKLKLSARQNELSIGRLTGAIIKTFLRSQKK